ncbi:riboflavin biosynthesis protein RibD [Armatimonadetes bacterium Uphvl-Ar1]|nr:riboflavin biosynthesis protein RibD [Armatimonadetes bacterium Uphvl-Ar1]
MARAIELARGGFPAPNPRVGCVLVRDGVVIGEGFHDHAGGPHAEVVALSQCDSARGATAYVTLEPCNHTGRTGPCSVALIEAGVSRVVFAVRDPFEKARGGAGALLAAGIEVDTGVLEEEARAMNHQFLYSVEFKKPYVTLKAAITRDGFLARPDGTSQWISSEEARLDAHRLRAERGSVLVGRGTVLADNPRLTARIPGVVNQPLRVIVDPWHRLTGQERVFDDSAETLWLDQFHGANLSPDGILKILDERGVRGVLVEGGADTLRRFLTLGVGNELVLYVGDMEFGEGLVWDGGWGGLDGLKLIDRTMFGTTERRTYQL